MTIDVGGDERHLPSPPASFTASLVGKHFTNDADQSAVIELYERLATSVLGAMNCLDLDSVSLSKDGL